VPGEEGGCVDGGRVMCFMGVAATASAVVAAATITTAMERSSRSRRRVRMGEESLIWCRGRQLVARSLCSCSRRMKERGREHEERKAHLGTENEYRMLRRREKDQSKATQWTSK